MSGEDVRDDASEEKRALREAALAGDVAALRELAGRGVDLDQAVDDHGNTAAETAARSQRWAFVREVRALGGDLSKRGMLSCLAWAVSLAPAECETLLEIGCPHSERDGSSQALRSAAESNARGPVDLLLAAGAQIGAADAQGRTPLSAAARMGHQSMVAHLLARGADPDGGGGEQAPLLLAQKHGRGECVRALIEGGASLDVRDAEGRTALERARGARQGDIVALLSDAAAPSPAAPSFSDEPRSAVPTAAFASLRALLEHWGSVEVIGPTMWRVRRGAWTAWVNPVLAGPHDCTVALEAYGLDPSATWPAELLAAMGARAVQTFMAASAPTDRSLARHLRESSRELRVPLPHSAPARLFTERDWALAVVDRRADAFGGRFVVEGVEKSVVSLLPLTLGEWIFRGEGVPLAEVRRAHEALDRDVLASPYWREAWHAEAGGTLPEWLARQADVRARIRPWDGSTRPAPHRS